MLSEYVRKGLNTLTFFYLMNAMLFDQFKCAVNKRQTVNNFANWDSGKGVQDTCGPINLMK